MEWFFNGKGLALKGFFKGIDEKGKKTTKRRIDANSLIINKIATNHLISTDLTEPYNQLQ